MNIFEIVFDIQKSVFERSIDPRFFVDDLRELGECEVVVESENIPGVEDEVDDSHSYKAKVTLKTDSKRSNIEEVLEFIIHEGVFINTIQEESESSEAIEIDGEEIPKRLLENYFVESKNVLSRLNENLSQIESDLGNRDLLNALFREFHTLKGGTGVLLSYQNPKILQNIKDIAHLSEGMLIKFRDEGKSLDTNYIDLLQQAIDRLDDLISSYEQNIDYEQDEIDDILELLKEKSGIDISKKEEKRGSLEVEVIKELQKQYSPIYREIIEKRAYDEDEELFLINSSNTLTHISLDNGFGDLSTLSSELEKEITNKNIEGVVSKLSEIDAILDGITLAPQRATTDEPKNRTNRSDTAKYIQKNSILRIDERVVNELMNLVGEMSVFKEWIGYFGNRLKKDYDNSDASKELKEKHQRFANLVGNMQDIVLEMRMMPLSTLFERFPKLVRDISRSLGKRISFEVDGAETKLDKVIIEKIGEPMVHLIRNALDHGIELPKDRESIGKNGEGTLSLKAYQLAGSVYIEIVDDGRGIDPEVVKRKALKSGVVDEQKIKEMSEEEIKALVLLPGFSTKDEATELSGRGVGTDAVLSTVRSIGGELYLESNKNIGTKVTLELPLTLAIQKILLCKIKDEVYGIAADSINEIIKIEKEQISFFKNLHIFIHRGNSVAIDYAWEKLGFEHPLEIDELTLLVDNSKTRAIAVDSLLNTIDTVVKPAPNLIESIKEITGVTILGDGTIVYILNI